MVRSKTPPDAVGTLKRSHNDQPYSIAATKLTTDSYIAREAYRNSFEVWETCTETPVVGCTALAESKAIDMARRLSEIYRRLMSYPTGVRLVGWPLRRALAVSEAAAG